MGGKQSQDVKERNSIYEQIENISLYKITSYSM
jgi:hypothetical protein